MPLVRRRKLQDRGHTRWVGEGFEACSSRASSGLRLSDDFGLASAAVIEFVLCSGLLFLPE